LQVADEDQDRDDCDYEQLANLTHCDTQESSNGTAQNVAYDIIQDVSIVCVQNVPPDVPFRDVPFLDDVVQDVPVFVPYEVDADDVLQDVTVDDPIDDFSVVQDAPVDVLLRDPEQALQEPSCNDLSTASQQVADRSHSDAKDNNSTFAPVSIV